ncbi:MAG: NADH-quinone oxidoreductase subunit NuoE [Calditrichia bacterium]|jgi:NADH-quinone oxidoreductase subunit E
MSATVNLVNDAVKKYGKKRENLLPVLQAVVREEKYLTEQAMIEIARALDISSAEVYGTASFYTFLDLKPRGKNVIRVCKTITCYMKGKDDIIKAIEDRLKLKIGETTSDGKFSFLTTNCMGWCHKGPAMLINDKVYTELTPKKAIAAIEECF